MIMDHYLIVLSCLATIVVIVSGVSPTKSPECDGMNRMKASLEKGVQSFTKEPIKCLVNEACTGVSCNGTHKSEPFYMSMILQHCMKPNPEIHLDLVYPDKGLNIHQELKQGTSLELYKIGDQYTVVELHLSLTRKQNKITTSLDLRNCWKALGTCTTTIQLIPDTTFCVNMDACPAGKFNTTGYTPCHVPSTPTPSSTASLSSPLTPTATVKTTDRAHHSSKPSSHTTGHVKTTDRAHHSSKPSSHTPGHAKTTARAHHSSKHSSHTPGHVKTTERAHHHSSKPSTPGHVKTTERAHHSSKSSSPVHDNTTESTHGTLKPTSPEEPGVKGHQKGDGHHHMSVGVAVGIGFAVVACILIVIGVLIYWKKFHHRSRLRAAYYNDISMNEPLYEDFGPEVA